MGALETYLTAVRNTRLSGEGVSELSYYPTLHALLEDEGGRFKPKVSCFMNLRNQGAGRKVNCRWRDPDLYGLPTFHSDW